MPALYVVSTPIGNLEDITLRALRVLGEVGAIAAEDTRTTRRLLSKYGIRTRLISYHQFSGERRTRKLLEVLDAQDLALVSEAGTPGINDPGYPLIRAAIRNGFPVIPVPGPSAVTTALAVAGLPTDQFTYVGFLPRRPGERRRLLESFREDPRTLVALESPHRLRSALEDTARALGNRPLAVCRELTKLYEEVHRGSPESALDYFKEPRGEFTLIIGGARLGAGYWTAAGQEPAVSLDRR